MDFGSMKRKKLQALCKKHGIPANLTNLEMAGRLSSVLKAPEKTSDHYAREQLAESNLEGYENKMDAKDGPIDAKKVRFSPENETFIFLPSNVKTSGKPKQITRSRLPGKASMKRIDSSMRITRSRAQDLAKKVVVVDVPPVIAAKRMRCSRGRNIVEITGNNQERSDGVVDAEDRQELENIVPRKRAEDNRSKGQKSTSRHFFELFETANSTMEHQRDDRRRQRKKLKKQKNNDEVFAVLDKKPEEIKISGRVTRSQSMIIYENSLELAKISEVESQGSEAEQLSAMKNDSSNGTVEHYDQDYWNGNRVSELGKLKPADKVDRHHPNEDEPICGCETTQHQMRNSTVQTEASRIDVQDIFDIQTKISGPSVVAGAHVMKNEEVIEPGPQYSCLTTSFVGQRNLEGREFALGRLEMFDEALCSERDGEILLSDRRYNQNNIAETIDKQNANQDALLAVGPLMAVRHMDASNECPQSLSPGRNSVAPRKYEAQSSGQQDDHPQGSDYASNQIPTESWNEFLWDITSTLEGKSTDMTNCQGTPRLVENQCSDKQKVLDEYKEGTCTLDLHFNWGETYGGSSVNPQTNRDASLRHGCIITEKMSDPSVGISSVFNLLSRGDDAEACSGGHPKTEAADALRRSTSPTRLSDDRQDHLERKYEDDVDHSGGLSGGQFSNLRINDVRPYFHIEPCDDYHLPEVAADSNVETFSEAETSIDWHNYTGKKHEQENKEEFSTFSQSLASVREKTGNRILHHCSIWKKVSNSDQEDMEKHKLDQINIEDDLARLDQELLSTEVSGDHMSLVQTANSGLAHSDNENSSSKAHKSVRLPDQDIHEHTGKTPQAPLGGSFGESFEILQMGESTPEQDAIISKDELAITSPSAPKSSKVKSFTRQDIKVIMNLVDENSTRSMLSKRISSLENCEGSTSRIDHNASSPITELESKLTSPATLLEDIRSSKCSSVEVALVEDVQWLERALLDDTYDCTVECTESPDRASQQEEAEETHKITVQENAQITTIQNALVSVSDSDRAIIAVLMTDEKTENPLNAQKRFEVGEGEIKCYAAEDLYPLFREGKPKHDQTVQNLGSSKGQKIKDERVELNIPKFTETEKENEVGVEKTDIIFGLLNSENQPIHPCVEQLSDASRDAGKQNDSHMLADEVQASDRMDESRSPHTQAGCTPILSVVNSANQDFSKFSDVRAEDLTFTCVMSGISLDASNTSRDNQNVRFERENAMEGLIQLLQVQETPNAEQIANDTHIAESVAEKPALADDFLAKNIGLMDDNRTVLKSSIRHNEGQINPYSDADYLPEGTLSSENRDNATDLSSKQTARTDMAKTPLRTDPMVSDMKENMSNIHKVRASTTADASKTWTKRRALDPLPNK